MSKSYRDTERRIFKKKYQDMHVAINQGSPETSKKVRECKETKEVFHEGNERKANAKLKVKFRRLKRRRLNIIQDME